MKANALVTDARYPGTESRLDYCPFCGSWDGLTYLELCSLFARTDHTDNFRLSYPGNGPIVAFVSHDTCGPDAGYAIPLDDLRADVPGWKEHLREKIWNCLGVMQAVDYVTARHFRRHQTDRFTAERHKLPLKTPPQIKTYLIQSELGGHVKIGKSTNPESRLRSLQTGRADRLVLKRVIAGDLEASLHARFKNLREGGEWFRFEGPLIDFLAGEA